MHALGGDADAGVADDEFEKARLAGGGGGAGAHFDGDAAGVGEFDGVVDEVREDLAQASGVAEHEGGDGGIDGVGECEAFGGGLAGEEFEGLLDAGGDFEGDALKGDPAGLDGGKVEDVVEHGQERLAGGADGADALALVGGELAAFEEEAGHAEHAVEGGADLVGHGGEELALGARSLVGLGFGEAECLFGLDAGGDVGPDSDEGRDGAGLVADWLDVEGEVVGTAGFAVEHDVGAAAAAVCECGAQAGDGLAGGVGASEQVGGAVAGDLLRGVAHRAGEALVDPLGAAVGGEDDDKVVGARGDEGEFTRGGLAGARGFFGGAPGGDVLECADDALG
ncbi:MAG: hypothetical protein BWX86_00663 [Verrucomicrobia bacterium ADurb.Bin122]|nr:MAG: hypothetical protein BWX86_00663 [Verrucomicrobia bacterium ADurb.Bin122]